jgi:signal peptidase II
MFGGLRLKWKTVLKRYLFLIPITGFILLIDQLSKAYIRATFTGPEGVQMWAPWDWMLPYARIIHVSNSGVAFGMLQGFSMIFAVLAALVSLAIIYYFPQVPEEDWVLRLSMSLMLAGAVGNLIDRITNNGVVTDFISVGSFPVFNIADSSITIGVIVLIIGMWYQEKQQKKVKEAEHRLDTALESDSPFQDKG